MRMSPRPLDLLREQRPAASAGSRAAALQVRMCKRAFDLLREKLDFDPQDIVFDPNILTVGTGLAEHNNYAVDFFEATRVLKQVRCPLVEQRPLLMHNNYRCRRLLRGDARPQAGALAPQYSAQESTPQFWVDYLTTKGFDQKQATEVPKRIPNSSGWTLSQQPRAHAPSACRCARAARSAGA